MTRPAVSLLLCSVFAACGAMGPAANTSEVQLVLEKTPT